MGKRIDYFNDPSAPPANSVKPSATASLSTRHVSVAWTPASGELSQRGRALSRQVRLQMGRSAVNTSLPLQGSRIRPALAAG